MEVNSMIALCKNCKFYNPIFPQTYGECRKNPPARLPRKFDKDATAGNRVRDEEIIWGWPIINQTDWCGKFKRRKRIHD